MTDLKAVLLQQLDACLSEGAWQVSLRRALKDLAADDAGWRGDEATHSAWQLVRHLAYWNERWLDRFLGRPAKPGVGSNDATFEAAGASPSESTAGVTGGGGDGQAAWERDVARLEATLSGWRDAVAECDEDRLREPVSERDASPWWVVASCVVMHNLYHLGQIVDVRKRQGSWEPANL